jgi:hypothetical protein
MKHVNTITRTPGHASIVEFDALIGVLGRTITAFTSTINFLLFTLGVPNQIDKIKGDSSS